MPFLTVQCNLDRLINRDDDEKRSPDREASRRFCLRDKKPAAIDDRSISFYNEGNGGGDRILSGFLYRLK